MPFRDDCHMVLEYSLVLYFLLMGILLLEGITYVKKISKKKPTVKRFLAHINSLRTNNWNESVVEETLYSLHTKWIINENYKILITNVTNTLSTNDELLETLLVSNTNNTLPDPSLLLFQEVQFSTSNSTTATTIIHSAVTSVTPNSHWKENSNHNKNDLKEERIEQLNAELKHLNSFIREEPYVMEKTIEDIQVKKQHRITD